MQTKEMLDEVVNGSNTALERGAKQIPTNVFWVGAIASIGLSLGFKIAGRDRDAEFVGHWAPTFIGLGILRKLMDRDVA